MESSVHPSSPIEPTGSSVHSSTSRGHRWHTPPAGSPKRLRLDLQRRAQVNLRRHVQRGAKRFLVLVLADLVSFGLMRELIRAVRDVGVFGGWTAGVAQSIAPSGILNGWQYASALFVSLLLLGCYRAGDRRRDPRRLFLAAALATALPLWMRIWIRGPSVVVLQYVITTCLVWVGLLSERLAVDWVVERVRPKEETEPRTLFVGNAAEVRAVTGMPAFHSGGEFRFVGFIDVDLPQDSAALGHLVEVGRVIHSAQIDTVVVCGNLTEGQLNDLLEIVVATGCRLLMLPRGLGVPGVQPEVVWRRGQPLVELTAPTLEGWQLVMKRGVDVLGATVALLLAAPLMALIAMAIRLESEGSPVFNQERIGLGGRPFRMFKFRTMRAGADSEKATVAHLNHSRDARLFKIPNDPRVTRVGRWLRAWSLDELLQFWNVLVGDMSLVGPRPFFGSDLELYELHHFVRLGVKPGMTGLWQVNGRSDIADFEQVVALDAKYVREWSLWLDCGILARTIPAVLRRRGAV